MRRNTGVIGPKREASLDNATGVHDSYDEYNSRLSGTWPRNYTATVSAVDMKQNESKTATITFTGGIDNGTYYWTLENLPSAVTSAAVLSATSGSFTVTNGSGTISLTSTLKSTFLTTDQTFNIAIRRTSITGAIIATSATCYLRACSVSVTVPSSVNEDSTVSITFAWSGLATNSGSNYYWTWQTNPSTTMRFLYNTTTYSTYSGNFVTSSTSNTNGSLKVLPDYVSGTKTFTISLAMNGTTVVTSSAITVNDTISNANNLSISAGTCDEGSSASISISGAVPYEQLNVSVFDHNGTTLSSGSRTVNSSGTISFSASVPYYTSASNTYYNVAIYNYNNTLIKSSSNIDVYNTTPSVTNTNFTTSVDETGTQINVQINGSNFYNKTFNWTVTGVTGTIDASDFASLSGSVTGSNNAYITIPLTINADTTTEGSESFYLALTWTDPNSNTVTFTNGLGLHSNSPIVINDTSKKPVVGPGFILSTATKVSDFSSYNSYQFPANSSGGWLTLFKRIDSTKVYLQTGQSGSYDAPVAYLNYTSLPGSITNYASYNGSNQYPTLSGWQITRPSWNSDGSKAWFWRTDGRFYEYVPSGTQNYGLLDLGNYNSLSYSWAYSTVNSNYVFGGGDCQWNNDGTALWVSYATNYYNNSYNNYKIVYHKYTLVNGGTPYNNQHLNSNAAVTLTRGWTGSFGSDCAQFQFNHDGTQVYMHYENLTGNSYDFSKANKIVSYALTTPYDLQSGTTSNTFDNVIPAQEWSPTTPSWSQFNPGLLRSFFFDNKEWNKIYIAWAADNYSYQGLSVYTVADPEPASAITVTPQFKLSSATLKNTTSVNTNVPYYGGSQATLISGVYNQTQTGRTVAIPYYDQYNSSMNSLQFYDVTLSTTTANLVQTQSNFGTWIGNAYIRYGGYSFWSAGPTQGNSSSITLTQIYGGPQPYSFPSQVPWSGNSYQITLPSGTQCSGVGSGWVEYNSATSTYVLYIAYSDSQGPYYTRLAKWEAPGGPSWNGATGTLVTTLASTFYGSAPNLYYSTKYKFNDDSGTQVTTIRGASSGFIPERLVTFTCTTPWVPPVAQGSPDPASVYTLQMPSNQYSIVNFDFDRSTQDTVYVLVYDSNTSSYKLLVYSVPMPYLNWSNNQPTDTPTVNTLGPQALIDGGNNSSFSIIFDTEAHATQFETVLKGYLDANIYNDGPNNIFSYMHVTYGGRYSTVTWPSATTGKSSYVTRTAKTVDYNSGNGTNDITVYTTWSPDGMWWTTNTVNRVGFYYANYASNTKISFDSAVNGIAYNTAGFDTLASACNTAGVGILDAYGKNKSKWLYYDIYGSNDNGYLDSPATGFLGMSFTGAGVEPYSYYAQNASFNGNRSELMFTLADAKNAVTDPPATSSGGGLTITKALTATSVNQYGPSSYQFNFSTEAKATSLYNAIFNWAGTNQVQIQWSNGMYSYYGYPTYVNKMGTTVSVEFNNGINQNYIGGSSTISITWKYYGAQTASQNGPNSVQVDLASSSIEAALAAGDITFYPWVDIMPAQQGQSYFIDNYSGAVASPPYIIMSGSVMQSWNGGSGLMQGNLGTKVPATLATSMFGAYYAMYQYGTLFLDFNNYTQYQTILNAVSTMTSITINDNGNPVTWTASPSFSGSSWGGGPWGNGWGVAINVNAPPTTGSWPYNGYSINYVSGSYQALAELVTFSLPYTMVDHFRFVPSNNYLRIWFPTAADGSAFAQWLPTQPPNTQLTFDGYDDWSGTSYRFTIYYNTSEFSISDPYGTGYQVVQISWQYPWNYQDYGSWSGSYGSGNGRITSP
jgi:hypothetical protein